jgi:hypothetical protein
MVCVPLCAAALPASMSARSFPGGKMVLSKIVNPLTVIRLTALHDDAGERLWGTMLATYCVNIELISRPSHQSSKQDSSHSHITTVTGGGVRVGGVRGSGEWGGGGGTGWRSEGWRAVE